MILTLYEPFRHWSETGSVYILSDLHFADADCKQMDPGWVEPEEQVAIINKTVMKNDTFVCLGDVGNPAMSGRSGPERRFCFWEIMIRRRITGSSLMKSMMDRFLLLKRLFFPMNRYMVCHGA